MVYGALRKSGDSTVRLMIFGEGPRTTTSPFASRMKKSLASKKTNSSGIRSVLIRVIPPAGGLPPTIMNGYVTSSVVKEPVNVGSEIISAPSVRADFAAADIALIATDRDDRPGEEAILALRFVWACVGDSP